MTLYQYWSFEEDNILRARLAGVQRGKDMVARLRALSEELGRTSPAVRTRWQILEHHRYARTRPKAPVRPFTAEEDAHILVVCSGSKVYGHTYEKLARDLDRTIDAVRHRGAWLKAQGAMVSPQDHDHRLSRAPCLPVAQTPPWMKPLTRAQLMAGRA